MHKIVVVIKYPWWTSAEKGCWVEDQFLAETKESHFHCFCRNSLLLTKPGKCEAKIRSSHKILLTSLNQIDGIHTIFFSCRFQHTARRLHGQ